MSADIFYLQPGKAKSEKFYYSLLNTIPSNVGWVNFGGQQVNHHWRISEDHNWMLKGLSIKVGYDSNKKPRSLPTIIPLTVPGIEIDLIYDGSQVSATAGWKNKVILKGECSGWNRYLEIAEVEVVNQDFTKPNYYSQLITKIKKINF